MQCACVSCVCTHCNTSNCIISGTPATVSPLQHSATYCNTLQHTTTHCNTLQHAATHCNTLQHPHQYHHRRKRKQSCQISIPQSCSTLQHTVTHCSTLQKHCKHTADSTKCGATTFFHTIYTQTQTTTPAYNKDESTAQCTAASSVYK